MKRFVVRLTFVVRFSTLLGFGDFDTYDEAKKFALEQAQHLQPEAHWWILENGQIIEASQ